MFFLNGHVILMAGGTTLTQVANRMKAVPVASFQLFCWCK